MLTTPGGTARLHLLLLLAMGLCAAIGVSIYWAPASLRAQDQASKSTPAKRKVFRTRGRQSQTGTDTNVKGQVYTSTLTSATTLAPNKTKVRSGATAAGVCAIHIDNWTNANVDIFLGGEYSGTVGAGATMDIPVPNGELVFYARIDLDQSTWIPLGPDNFNCDGNFSFTITP
jgi:hypothetical protein